MPHEVLAPFLLIRWLVSRPPVCFPAPLLGFLCLSAALLEAHKTLAAPSATLVCFSTRLLALQQLFDKITRPFVTPSGLSQFYSLGI